MSRSSPIFTPITLPCGRVVQNRLVKVALYEHLGPFQGGLPNQYHFNLYSKWAQHRWGMVITGNVMDPRHLTLGRDMIIPDTITDESIRPYTQLAKVMHGNNNGTLALMQVSHSGRQSSSITSGSLSAPLAPSAIKMGSNRKAGLVSSALTSLMFRTPQEMTTDDIDKAVETFVRSAIVAERAGFDGVEIHAAHGYLLAQFLSPKSNKRHDEYSVTTPENAVRVVSRIIRGIRAAVQNPQFVLGIKLNSADYSESLDAEERVISYVRELTRLGMVDFIEISGGDYDNPDFITGSSKLPSGSPRQALFARFSQTALSVVSSYPSPPLIMVTGGLYSPALFNSALSRNHAQLLGIGRMSIVRPDLPTILPSLDGDSTQQIVPLPDLMNHPNFFIRWLTQQMSSIPLLGAGIVTAWYTIRLREHALNQPLRNDSGLAATARMQFWVSDQTYYGFISLLVVVLGLTVTKLSSTL